jgi:Na+-driven multidrug efflux pump
LTNIISNGVAAKESKQSLGAKTYGALIVSFCLSLLVAGILILHTETLLSWLKTPKEVMAAASAFTKIRAIGMPAAYLTTAAYAVLVARKDTVSPLACVCLAATVNVLLDYLAVARMGMGAAGAAWATTVALWVGCGAILDVVRKRGFADAFPWGTLRYKEQMAPVMAFFGPITFLVFALLSIYTALILFANGLGVTVSAAHRIAGNVFAVAVLCGDPLIQAGQAFMPKYLLPSVPLRAAARKMAGLLQQVGFGAGAFAGTACAVTCLFGGGAFTNDAAVVSQVRAVVVPMCAAVIANVVSKSMYGVTVAAKQLVFLAAITGAGLVLFALALWRMNAVLVGPALYYWMWWVVAGYYALAIVCIQVLTFGGPGGMGFKGLFHDAPVENDGAKETVAPAA